MQIIYKYVYAALTSVLKTLFGTAKNVLKIITTRLMLNI